MQIFVILANGKIIVVDIEPMATVLDLKQKVAEILEIDPAEQRLIFESIQLENHLTLQHYGIQDENQIQLLLRLKGGLPILESLISSAEKGTTTQILQLDPAESKALDTADKGKEDGRSGVIMVIKVYDSATGTIIYETIVYKAPQLCNTAAGVPIAAGFPKVTDHLTLDMDLQEYMDAGGAVIRETNIQINLPERLLGMLESVHRMFAEQLSPLWDDKANVTITNEMDLKTGVTTVTITIKMKIENQKMVRGGFPFRISTILWCHKRAPGTRLKVKKGIKNMHELWNLLVKIFRKVYANRELITGSIKKWFLKKFHFEKSTQ